MEYFHTSKFLKLAFLSSLTTKYVLWKGFYHDFSTKKASASGGFALTPTKGLCPMDPRGSFALPNDLPWRRPCPYPNPFSVGLTNLFKKKKLENGNIYILPNFKLRVCL